MSNNLAKLPKRTKLDLYIARCLLIMHLWRKTKEKKQSQPYNPRTKFRGYRDYWQMENND